MSYHWACNGVYIRDCMLRFGLEVLSQNFWLDSHQHKLSCKLYFLYVVMYDDMMWRKWMSPKISLFASKILKFNVTKMTKTFWLRLCPEREYLYGIKDLICIFLRIKDNVIANLAINMYPWTSIHLFLNIALLIFCNLPRNDSNYWLNNLQIHWEENERSKMNRQSESYRMVETGRS